jgi:hypothetical protein
VVSEKCFGFVKVCCQSSNSWLCAFFFVDMFYFLLFSVVLQQISYVMVVKCASRLIKDQIFAGNMWV